MKIVYLLLSIHNSGGMERVLCNKANWLVEHGHDVTIVTTDQRGLDSFFDFSPKIKIVDLGVNYTDNLGRSFFYAAISYMVKHRVHRKRLTELLISIEADIVISMFGADVDFLYKIKDGSRKIAEIHMSKEFRIKMDRKGLFGLADRWRAIRDKRIVSQYDRFVVLSNTDKRLWGDLANTVVIYNALPWNTDRRSSLDQKRVISVGRLSYDKGFDMLVNTWKQVNDRYPDWQLMIVGSGPEMEQRQQQIDELNLTDNIKLLGALTDVEPQYMKSSIYVLSSRHESFGMALIEAMSCGVPCVSFDCSGPSEIITNGIDGFMVTQGDISGLAAGVCRLIEDRELRRRMGRAAAVSVRERFGEDEIMGQWVALFNNIIAKK